jgi:hypothetical protein
MNMTKRLEAIEAAIAKQHGGNVRLAIRANEDETNEEARARLGLLDWPGVVVLLSNDDVNL